MKFSHFFPVLLSTLLMTGLASCDPNKANNPGGNTPNDSIPSAKETDSFERMALLEQFTSEHCVNCPTGVKQIEQYLASHPKTIWLSHHAGYDTDKWTIKASSTIARLMGVSNAPAVTLDRTLLHAVEPGKYQATDYNIHPYYLEFLTNEPSATTTASIRIKNDYQDGKLHIRVAGKLKAEAPDSLLLSVVIKESGLHGTQSDPVNTLAGQWEDYIHAHTIRTYVSAIAGDTLIATSDSTYEMSYDIELDKSWVADNCMVVAFLTESNSRNVVQAAEKPVVKGTAGGANLEHGGVTPKAVPEGYPEGKYSMKDFIKADTVYFQAAAALTAMLPNGMREWHIQAITEEQSYGSGQNTHIPFCDIAFFTEGSVSTIPSTGVYTFKVARAIEDLAVSTAWAGYCDVEAQKIIGSELQLISKTYYESGTIIPGTNGRWLIAEGTIEFKENGFAVNAKSATGKDIRLQYSGRYNYAK